MDVEEAYASTKVAACANAEGTTLLHLIILLVSMQIFGSGGYLPCFSRIVGSSFHTIERQVWTLFRVGIDFPIYEFIWLSLPTPQ